MQLRLRLRLAMKPSHGKKPIQIRTKTPDQSPCKTRPQAGDQSPSKIRGEAERPTSPDDQRRIDR